MNQFWRKIMSPMKKTTNKSKSPVKKSQTTKTQTASMKKLIEVASNLSNNEILNLIKQAEILIHNKNVIQEFEKNKKERKKQNVQIEKKRNSKTEITIQEGKDNSYFIIRINGKGKSFTLDEMKKIVKFSHSSNTNDACEKIFSWFKRERVDALNDYGMETPDEKILKDLVKILKNTYSA